MVERVDKNKQLAPFVSETVYLKINDIRSFLDKPRGEVSKQIMLAALDNNYVIESIAPYFKRGYIRNNSAWFGRVDHADLDEIIGIGVDVVERLYMRVSKEEWNRIDDLAVVLGRKPVHAAATLLICGLNVQAVIEQIAPGFLERSPYALKRGVTICR